jgi:hypothetical protein
VAAAAGSVLTLVPFYIWNPDHFLHHGPFAVQSSYLDTWLLAIVLAGTVAIATIQRTYRQCLWSSGLCLYGVIALAFILAIGKFGFVQSTIGDRFDISYFAFAQPFLLFSLIKPRSGLR